MTVSPIVNDAISYMSRYGGGNFRIEEHVEPEEYTTYESYDTNTDGQITFVEYLQGQAMASITAQNLTNIDLQIARNIDFVMDRPFLDGWWEPVHEDEMQRRKICAVYFLGSIGGEAVVPVLIGLLENSNSGLADAAVNALAGRGSSSVPALIEALGDPCFQNRARQALIQIGQEAIPSLELLGLEHPISGIDEQVQSILAEITAE